MSPIILAIDIGGTHVSAAQVGTDGLRRDTLVRHAVDGHSGADELLGAWARAALEAAGGAACSHVACSIPGPFEYGTGVARFTQKLRALAGNDVTAGLRARWSGSSLAAAPVTYVNDAVAFTQGEYACGHGQGARRVLGITLGTGFGSGFLVDGVAVTGGPDVPPGGEVGLLPLYGGVADDHLSGPGLQRAYAHRSGEQLSAHAIAIRALRGDLDAAEVFHAFGHDLGTVLAPWAARFCPDTVVIGGQISRAWPLFAPTLICHLSGPPLLQSTLLDDANLLGAAFHVRPFTGAAPPGPRHGTAP